VDREWGGSLQLDTIIQDDSRSGDIQKGNFSLSGPLLEDTLGLQLYGSAYSRQEDRFVDGYEEKKMNSLNARLSFTPTDNQDWILEASRTNQRRRSLIGYSAPATGCRGGCTDSDNEFSREAFSLSHTGRWDFGTTDTYVQREEAENETREMEITNTSAKSSLVLPLGDHMLTLGANVEKEELSDQTSNRISDRTEVDATQWAVFAEDEYAARQCQRYRRRAPGRRRELRQPREPAPVRRVGFRAALDPEGRRLHRLPLAVAA